MALWKDASNIIHDDMDGIAVSLPSWPQGMIQITRVEADAILASQVLSPTLQQLAQTILERSDITMLRCVEAGIQVPIEWNTYRKGLRAIATGKDSVSTSLPLQPPYPLGT